MAETQLPTVEKKLRIAIETATSGPDLSKSLAKTQKSISKIEKQLSRYTSTWEKQEKRIREATISGKQYDKMQERINRAIRQSHRPLSKSIELLKRQRREMRENTFQAGRLGRSLKSMTGMLAGLGLGYMAMRRLKEVVDKRFSLALTGGVDQINLIKQLTKGRGTTAAIDLASRFQQQSPYARFSLGKESIAGLVKTQQSLAGIGLDRANEVILNVTKALEPEKLKQFLQTAASGSIRDALLGAASGQNVGAITTALNALQIGKIGESTGDPLLDAAKKYEEASQALTDKFDSAVDEFAKSIKLLVGVLAAGALLKGVGFARGLGGLGRGVSGVGRGLGSVFGRPVGNVGTGVGTALARRVGLRTMARPLSLGMRVTGGVGGVGLPAAAAAGSLYTLGRSGQTALQERAGLAALDKQMKDSRLFDIANEAKAKASTSREKLIAKRKSLDALINSQAAGAGVDKSAGFVADLLGFTPELPKVNQKQLDKLREQRREIAEQIRQMDATASAGFAKTATAAKAASDATGKLESNLERLQQQAAKRQELTLSAGEKASVTALARTQMEIARTTPLGTVGALPELEALQKALSVEIASLTKVMESIDRSTTEGVIESNKIKGEILGLKLEQRTNARMISSAVLDSIVSSAFGAGAFEKILTTRDMNLAAGIQRNIVKEQPLFTGATGATARGSTTKPVKIHDASNEIEAFENLAKAAKQAATYAQERQDARPQTHLTDQRHSQINTL